MEHLREWRRKIAKAKTTDCTGSVLTASFAIITIAILFLSDPLSLLPPADATSAGPLTIKTTTIIKKVAASDDATAGSDGEITIKEGGRGSSHRPPPCSISISMHATPLTFGSLVRGNPDGTYYPGDALSILLAVSSLHCTSTGTFLAGDSTFVTVACPTCTTTYADISPFAPYGTYMLRASAFGEGPGGSGHASAAVPVVVTNPMITVEVTPADVKDADGYLMRNADHTHYVNDAVALTYRVDYMFNQERRGVIEPEVARLHPYPRIADQDCLQDSCVLSVPATAATSEYREEFVYASGITVANATSAVFATTSKLQDSEAASGSAAGAATVEAVFTFEVTLKNAGANTAMIASHSHAVGIADYAPVFSAVYPYLNLKEGGGKSYEKKLVAGIHYLGSADSDGTVKPLRRAKLNSYANEVSALVVGTGYTDIKEQADLTWLSTSTFYTDADPGTSTVTQMQPGKNAMLERAGYAKVTMKMEGYREGNAEKDNYIFLKMQNVTASPAFYSRDFAGKEMLKLFDVEYTYPDTHFTNIITARVFDDDRIEAGRVVRLEAQQAGGSTTTTVCEYYDRHALYSTGDATFSEMVLSDTYLCSVSGQYADASGVLNMRVNKTGIVIPRIYDILYPGGPETLPHSIALSFPSSIMLQMSVSGIRSVTDNVKADNVKADNVKTYDLALYAHDRDVEIIANVGQNNSLEAVRYGTAVTVKSPANFGTITDLQINGISTSETCFDRCAIEIPHAATIVATNEWGGKAIAKIATPAKPDNVIIINNNNSSIPAPKYDTATIVLAIVGGGAAAVVAGVIFKKYVSWLDSAFF